MQLFINVILKYFINAFDPSTIEEITTGMEEICKFLVSAPFLGAIAAAGLIYAVILCVNISKAETSDKKKEAYKRMYSAIFGIVILLLVIIILNIYVNNADKVAIWINDIFFSERPAS